ncbi:MAG: hypothetical protein MO852_06630 [Candidatus Devosia euplotis]|nr:hypothetical protein [Candidatus Devosia euplotis]
MQANGGRITAMHWQQGSGFLAKPAHDVRYTKKVRLSLKVATSFGLTALIL